MKLTVAQLNPTIADMAGNVTKALAAMTQADKDDADLIIFPELFICGYPPLDLLERPAFIEACDAAVQKVVEASKKYKDLGIIIGAPRRDPAGSVYLLNAAVVIQNGRVIGEAAKTLLPTYDVFDERRYFKSGAAARPIELSGRSIGITICEDAWQHAVNARYDADPMQALAKEKCDLYINLMASPFRTGIGRARRTIFETHAKKAGTPVVYVNQVGGNDELVFDGRSMLISPSGAPLWQGAAFAETIETLHLDALKPMTLYPAGPIDTITKALILGIKDYARKCGFKRAIVGLSGGIDSAVTAALAVTALGPENVDGIAMPSDISSSHSVEDAEALATLTGLSFSTIPIAGLVTAFENSLKAVDTTVQDLTYENIQARIRGNLLMARSNNSGALLLTTGNKSELAVGYCTLYGDMAGGLSVLGDVPKTVVYQIANYLNQDKQMIPTRSIRKAPSAELRPGQRDQDSLPDYETLDAILRYYIDDGEDKAKLLKRGFEEHVIDDTIRRVKTNEYKRRQSAMVLKVTDKAFGMGRRIPVAAHYGL